jgi:hypothetical protein
MATKKSNDVFSNMATIVCLESAANTLTYKKLEVGFGTFEKVAWVIHRLEYYPFINSTTFNSADDSVQCALMTGNTRTSIITNDVFTDPQVIDIFSIIRWDAGTAASGSFLPRPITKDFSFMPSGGLIIPPAPLYGVIQSVGCAAANVMVIRIYYTIKELAVDEYWELVEARRMLTA